MYTPHTITLYSRAEDAVTLENPYNITVLNGVFVDETQGVNMLKSGLSTVDAVTVFIPHSVDAGGKVFVREKEYTLLDKSKRREHWTLRAGKDFFIIGEVVTQGEARKALEQMHDGVYSITTVDTKNFGTPDMQHWQIGGR